MRSLIITILACLLFGGSSEAQWVPVGYPPYGTSSLSVVGTDIYAIADRVYLSTDDGATWNSVSPLLPDYFSEAGFFVKGNMLYILEYCSDRSCHGIYQCEMNGTSWKILGMDGKHATDMSLVGSTIYAGTGSGIICSTDGGESWRVFALSGLSAFFMGSSGSYLFVGYSYQISTYSWGVKYLRTSDNGQTWELLSMVPFASSGGRLYATEGGNNLYYSVDDGGSWTPIGHVSSESVGSIATYGSSIFAAGTDGIFQLKTKGWESVNANLGAQSSGIWISGSNLIARVGLVGGWFLPGIWRRSLSEMVTSVAQQPGGDPFRFRLSQNYPNPFNPATTIRYELAAPVHVKLGVYDALGREVQILVDENKEAGQYQVEFNARDLMSGVYFYSLQAGRFQETRKLVLVQ
jgi:hypothetical protein